MSLSVTGRRNAFTPRFERIREAHADFRPERVNLLLARALSAVGRRAEARQEFALAVER